MRPLLSLGLLGLLALPACVNDSTLGKIDDGDEVGDPILRVVPETVVFGEAARSEVIAKTFTIINDGETELTVSGVTLAAEATSFSILTPPEELVFTLPPSAERTINVAFSPLEANEVIGEITVASNDPERPEVMVELIGTGLVPDLVIDPNPYDFGAAYIGCPSTGEISLRNEGRGPLTISDVVFDGDRAFTLDTALTLPLTLAASEEATVLVTLNPQEERTFDATLTVTSDAPSGTDVGVITGEGQYAGHYDDVWDIPEDPPVDLAFIVDQSGSMDDDQASLARNFGTFISRLSTYTTDWQIIVVNAYDGCNNTRILTASTSGYEATFQSAVSDGSQTEWEYGGPHGEALGESGLYVASQLVQETDPGECNDGFMREDALLHIVVVTDEPDQSREPWSEIVEGIWEKKDSEANTRISAVAGDYPSGCATAAAATGLYEAVMATGGEFLSICSNWGTNVEALADASIQLSEYELTHTPDPATLEVTVDGEPRTSGWVWDESSNTVIFSTGIPEGGSTVEISYSALVNCD